MADEMKAPKRSRKKAKKSSTRRVSGKEMEREFEKGIPCGGGGRVLTTRGKTAVKKGIPEAVYTTNLDKQIANARCAVDFHAWIEDRMRKSADRHVADMRKAQIKLNKLLDRKAKLDKKKS